MVLLKQINKTHLTLIPEKENPNKRFDYKPISLWNVSCKIISKLLANCFEQYFRIISPVQSVFVPNREIHDNILISHEILTIFSERHTKGEYVVIKLDMEKHIIDWNDILLRHATLT